MNSGNFEPQITQINSSLKFFVWKRSGAKLMVRLIGFIPRMLAKSADRSQVEKKARSSKRRAGKFDNALWLSPDRLGSRSDFQADVQGPGSA
jgi:hypothetical protein